MADHSYVVGHSCLRCGTGEPYPHGVHNALANSIGETERATASHAEYTARAYELREARKRAARGGYRGLMRAILKGRAA